MYLHSSGYWIFFCPDTIGDVRKMDSQPDELFDCIFDKGKRGYLERSICLSQPQPASRDCVSPRSGMYARYAFLSHTSTDIAESVEGIMNRHDISLFLTCAFDMTDRMCRLINVRDQGDVRCARDAPRVLPCASTPRRLPVYFT